MSVVQERLGDRHELICMNCNRAVEEDMDLIASDYWGIMCHASCCPVFVEGIALKSFCADCEKYQDRWKIREELKNIAPRYNYGDEEWME